jgi:hypothetical protein
MEETKAISITKLANYCSMKCLVCDFQATESKLNKLKKRLKKTDDYLATLTTRIDFIFKKLGNETYFKIMEIICRRYRLLTKEKKLFSQRRSAIVEDIKKKQEKKETYTACKSCIACKHNRLL